MPGLSGSGNYESGPEPRGRRRAQTNHSYPIRGETKGQARTNPSGLSLTQTQFPFPARKHRHAHAPFSKNTASFRSVATLDTLSRGYVTTSRWRAYSLVSTQHLVR
jgi:hypothetical protein